MRNRGYTHAYKHFDLSTSEVNQLPRGAYVTGFHEMVDKSHFGASELFTYSKREDNAESYGEKMKAMSEKIRKL